MDTKNGVIEDWEPVGDKGNHSCHTHQECKGILNKGDAGIDLYRPAAKLLFAQAASTTAIGDPGHYQAIHGGHHGDGKHHQPDTYAKCNVSHAGNDDKLQKRAKNVKRGRRRITAARQSSLKRVR